MGLFICTLFAFLLTNRANGATHWVVTEDGRIQSQMDSVFNLQRPYDLVAMLKQEDRARILEDLRQELLVKKERIDKSEDRDTGLEQRFYRTDPDCIAAGKRLPEFDLYISTVLPLENKGIRPEEHIDFKAQPVPHPVPPVCTDMVELHFSMDAFEHLEGVKERHNLTGSPELGLKNAITHRENVDDYGHLVYEALKKNKTSWVLYNMAAFYWRIKGHPYNVIECVRRALRYSPRNYKDVALISLANVLHRARYSNEAAIVVQAAIDISKELNVNHFTLGNIYAVLAEYNKSIICFENTLKIQPDFEAAEKRKHAVLCHAKLETALEDQHRSLQRTLNDLKEYQQQHEAWQALQEKMQQDQASSDTKFAQRVGYEAFKIRKMASAVEHCKMEEKDGKQVMRCMWSHSGQDDYDDIPHAWTQTHESLEFESKHEDTKISSKQSSIPPDLVYLEPVHPPKYMTRNTAESQKDTESEDHTAWPSKDECDKFVTKFPAWNEFPTTYLPPENKGFEVKILLTEAQGLAEGMQHSLPWYPPVCNMVTIPDGSEKTYDHFDSIQERAKQVQKMPDPAMKPILLSLVDGDVTEAEVGQRILTAIKKELGPPWMLYNLAALYWRVIGNSHQGIECLRHSLFFAPAKYRDVPLVNLANILYKLGQLDDAITVMRDALNINDLEPEVHYFLANILAAKGNLTGATFHYKQALLQEPDHDQAYASIRTLKCYDKFHRTAQSAAPKQISLDDEEQRQTCSKSCMRNTAANCYGNPKHTDSRLICKTVNGHESCVVELVTQNCEQGQCTQACSVSPLAMDNCEEPSGLKCTDNNQDLTSEANAARCLSEVKPPNSCLQSYKLEALTETAALNPVADPEFYDKMEEVKEYYKEKGLCSESDCEKYLIQQSPQQGPHIKLEVRDGSLTQIRVDHPNELNVGPSDCIIFNDGRKSEGCSGKEFRAFDFDKVSNTLSLDEHCGSHGNRPDEQQNSNAINDESGRKLDKNHCKSKTKPVSSVERIGKEWLEYDEDEDDVIFKEDEESELVHFEWVDEEAGEVRLPAQSEVDKNEQAQRHSDERRTENRPDPLRHITKVASIPWPTWTDCRRDFHDHNDFKKITFIHFSSTWVSVSAKNVNVRHLIDFQTKIKDLKKPYCKNPVQRQPESLFDVLPSLRDISQLQYSTEDGLANMLKILGGNSQSVDVIGTRIALSLDQKPESWALANLAALYWRVEGDAKQALNCLRLGYQQAPDNAKDIALLGVANILYKANMLDDALAVCDMALEADNTMVATHFTIANIYTTKGDWARARRFYESTLDLQASFHPAQERLHYLRCYKVLSNPNLFKDMDQNRQKIEL